MLTAFLAICAVANVFGLYATLRLHGFPNPGGRLLNAGIHIVGAAASINLLLGRI